VIKPGKPDELLGLVKSIRDFWLVQNRPAPACGPIHGRGEPV